MVYGGPHLTHPSWRSLKVGDRIWQFDENNRVYRNDPANQGRPTGGPIFSAYFVAHVITGETPQSWIVKPNREWGAHHETKVSKKTLTSAASRRGGIGTGNEWHSDDSREDKIWLSMHRYKISHAIEKLTDAELLKHIATMIGYDATANENAEDRAAIARYGSKPA